MKRNVALAAGLAGGALAGILLRRRGGRLGARSASRADPRAEELRRKLAEARDAAADPEDADAAGMAGDTVSADQPPVRPTREQADSLRQRIHERGRETADEMRQAGDSEPR